MATQTTEAKIIKGWAEFDLADDQAGTFLDATGDDVNQDYVVRWGKIFEVGEYPDKNFSLNLAEMQAAVAAFKPFPLDLEHIPTVLDGQIGHLSAVRVGDDGRSLMGGVALPAWLDRAIEGKRKVSAAWERATKQLKGLSLVIKPRISDAALMSAFSADFLGIELDFDDDGAPVVTFAGARNSKADGQTVQAIHDHSCGLGAGCKPDNLSETDAKSVMLMGMKGGKAKMSDSNKEKDTTVVEDASGTATFAVERAALQSQITALQDANERAEFAHNQQEAKGWAAGCVKEAHAFPADVPMLEALFVRAALDDAADKKRGATEVAFAKFGQSAADAAPANRVDALRKFMQTRHSYTALTKEMLANFSPDAPGAGAYALNGFDTVGGGAAKTQAERDASLDRVRKAWKNTGGVISSSQG